MFILTQTLVTIWRMCRARQITLQIGNKKNTCTVYILKIYIVLHTNTRIIQHLSQCFISPLYQWRGNNNKNKPTKHTGPYKTVCVVLIGRIDKNFCRLSLNRRSVSILIVVVDIKRNNTVKQVKHLVNFIVCVCVGSKRMGIFFTV